MDADTLEKELAHVESHTDLPRLGGITLFGSYLPVLCGLSTDELLDRLLSWSIDYPDALSLLFKAAAQSDEASDAITWALCRVLSSYHQPRLVAPEHPLREGRVFRGRG